jgi:predicted MFS family arabinose efflux permease
VRRALASCCAPPFLGAMDFALLAVVAPDVTTARLLPWMFSAFSLPFGALLLPSGRLADRLGRERALRTGLVLFATGTALVAAGSGTAMLLAGRAVAGTGGALMTPAALARLTDAFAAGEPRRRALAAYGTAVVAGFMTGALAGGALATVLGWRAAVGVEAALALAAAAAVGRHDREPAAPRSLLAPARPRRGTVLAALGGAAVTATGVPGILVATTALRDAPPLATGLLLACFGAAIPLAGRIAAAGRPRSVLAGGLAVQGVAIAALGAAGTSRPALGAALAVFGAGHAAANAGAAMAVTAGLRSELQGDAAALLATAQYAGAACGPLALVGLPAVTIGGLACSAGALVAMRPRRASRARHPSR